MDNVPQVLLELSASQSLDSQSSQIVFINGSVETIGTQVSFWVDTGNLWNNLASQTRRGMHRQVERYQVRTLKLVFFELFTRKIHASNGRPEALNPGGWGRQAERLPSQFVGGYQYGVK